MSRELTDYDKGYLDGLLEGTAVAGPKWTDEYERKAETYLDKRGFKGWRVNARRVSAKAHGNRLGFPSDPQEHGE